MNVAKLLFLIVIMILLFQFIVNLVIQNQESSKIEVIRAIEMYELRKEKDRKWL